MIRYPMTTELGSMCALGHRVAAMGCDFKDVARPLLFQGHVCVLELTHGVMDRTALLESSVHDLVPHMPPKLKHQG